MPQVRMRNTALIIDNDEIFDMSDVDDIIVIEKIAGGSSEQSGEVELFVEKMDMEYGSPTVLLQ
jgi:hypothetical protein